MRDLHYDADFMHDFNEASKRWTWATWHHEPTQHDAVAKRLLADVFGQREDDRATPLDGDAQTEE